MIRASDITRILNQAKSDVLDAFPLLEDTTLEGVPLTDEQVYWYYLGQFIALKKLTKSLEEFLADRLAAMQRELAGPDVEG